MITKVVHGWRVAGLIAYLMGPGRAQEHVRPRVIASWDGRDAQWQPTQTGDSEFDRDLGPLIRAMRAPVLAAGLAEGGDEGKRGYVWQCSARVAAGDRVLSDGQWAAVARELLDGSGVAERSDAGGPRWVGIRHADDHVHIAVVLVRQDTSRRFWPSRDYPRLRETARRIEHRLGLTITAAADGTAARAPGRGEIEKSRRNGRESARLELARAARRAAVAAEGVTSFVAELESAGYLVELRRAPSGDPLGYKLARSGDVTSSGQPVFYSGSKLAPDLSLPRLMRGWKAAEQGSEAAEPIQAARRRIEGARAAIGKSRRGLVFEGCDDIVHATRDVLTAVHGWSGELREAEERFDRAARPPRHVIAETSPHAAGLRRVARQLVRRRHVLGVSDEPSAAAVALVVALSALLREIAAWQQERGRRHQATASASTARLLSGWAEDGYAGVVGATPGHGSAARRPQIDRAARRRSDPPRG